MPTISTLMALKGVTSRDQGLLEAAGLWADFCHFRSGLRSKGLVTLEASAEALMAFMPDGVVNEPSSLRLAEIERVAFESPSLPLKETDHETLELAPVALAGKAASEPEVVRWVVRNIDNPNASPGDCPDPFAWTLLRMCRDTEGFAAMFVRDIWTKLLVQQAKLGDDDSGRPMDGTPTLDLIGRIRELRDKSNRGVEQLAARRVHTPEVEGSSPSSAIGFEDFDEGAL